MRTAKVANYRIDWTEWGKTEPHRRGHGREAERSLRHHGHRPLAAPLERARELKKHLPTDPASVVEMTDQLSGPRAQNHLPTDLASVEEMID